MEERKIGRRRRQGVVGERYQPTGRILKSLATLLFRFLGLYGVGYRNAADLRIHQLEIAFPSLPAAFDGFTLLFASDIHIGSVPEVMVEAVRRIPDLTFDLGILGGDYQLLGQPTVAEATRLMEPLLASMRGKAPVLAILGNHDSHEFLPELQQRGICVLVNDHMVIQRGDDRLVLVGLDDVHAFYTAAAPAALRAAPDGFKIALVHSPEIADIAAEAGIALYLAGHTHGGQISLPGGRPIFDAMDRHRALSAGRWHYRNMQGYTSSGLGAGLPAIRFNTRPELALITLRRSA